MATDACETELVEQLFLDISIHDAVHHTGVVPVVEPWASAYVEAIRDGRYGDAVWARYHIEGDVHGGIIADTNKTVLEMIEEDATEHRLNASVQYSEALSFYATTSSLDRHTDIIEVISRIGRENVTEL